MTRQKKWAITDMRRKQRGGALVEYTMKLNISGLRSWDKERYFTKEEKVNNEYSVTFQAEEGLSDNKLNQEAYKQLANKEILDDYKIYLDSISADKKTVSFSVGPRYENIANAAAEGYGAYGGRRRTRKAKKLNKRKRKTIRGRK
jgi:hypothetical protein